ncbi:MAG: PAS domain S-box protein [Proteobacteria bacterium]|nr:PAS domain S-box protein [Pseudomonadota bacterium]
MLRIGFVFRLTIRFFVVFFPIISYTLPVRSSRNELGAPFIRNYSSKEYNAQPQNWATVQDKRGVLYFGNNAGLIIFDGTHWRVLEKAPFVRSLAIDNKGTIYLGRAGDFGYLAIDESGKQIFVSLKNYIGSKDKNFTNVYGCNATSHGIYFITENSVFRWYNGSLSRLLVSTTAHHFNTVHDKVFIPNKEGGISVLMDGMVHLLPHTNNFTEETFGRILFLPFSNRRILIATEKKGFFVYNIDLFIDKDSIFYDFSKSFKSSLVLTPFPTDIDDYINHNSLFSCTMIDHEHYAFGTHVGGIVIMDHDGKLVQIINKNRGLQDDSTMNLFADVNHNIWAATNTGISHIELSSPITRFDKLSGLEGFALSSIRHKGRMYAGTFTGIYHLPEYNMRVESDNNRFELVRDTDGLQCFGFFSKNNILLGSDKGVFQIIGDTATKIYNTKSNVIKYVQSTKFPNYIFVALYPGLKALELKSTMEDSENVSPIGSESISVYDFKELKKDQVFDMVNDNTGDLWATSTVKGLIHIDFRGDDISNYRITRYNKKHGLPYDDSNRVYFIENEVIVVTKDGIYKAIIPDDFDSNPEDVRFVPETSFGRFFVDKSITPVRIKVINEKQLLVNAEKAGVGILDKNQEGSYSWDPIPFKRIQGEVTDFFIEQNGIIWISDSDGLFRYDSKIKKDYKIGYNSLIRKVTIKDGSVLFEGTYYIPASKKGDSFTEVSTIQPDKMIKTLDYSNNSIIFEYTATSYEGSSKNSFKFNLEGFDNKWSDWSEETKKEYTNLPEGNYRFRIKAKNLFEHESSEAVYAFSITPPWYRTIWAYIGYAILFMLLFVGGIRINTRRLIAAKKRLEKIVKERTEVVVKQAEELRQTNLELEKLSIVASETDNAVTIMDAEGNIEWVNEAFERFYKLSYEEFIKEKGSNIVEASAYPKIENVINECITKNNPASYESYVKMKKGENIWTHTTLTPMTDKRGKLLKIIAIDSDITDLKKAEQKAISHAHKAGMADVAINTIHNVGNILNSVKTSIGMLPSKIMMSSITNFKLANKLLKENIDRMEDFICNDVKGMKLMQFYLEIEDKIDEERSEIEQEIKRVENRIKTIENVIDAQRGYTKDVEILVEEADLAEIIQDAITMNSDFIEKNNIKIEKEMTDIPAIPLQKMKVIQIIMSLITNAKEAMKETPSDNKIIKMYIEELEDSIQLRVIDTGCGIPLENISKIFRHGFTTKKKRQGFGLHNSANNMTEMGGKMWAESKGEGQGATLVLKFSKSRKGDDSSGV